MDKHLARSTNNSKRVLVAPLDWGLGHTTRCIPVIKHLLENDVEVFIAGNESQQNLIKKEFPTAFFLNLAGYNAQYSGKKTGMIWQMMKQSASFLQTIRREHKWLETIIDEYQLDGVISDNRFGLYSSKVPCVFITHQLHIKSPLGSFSEKMIQRLNYRFIHQFSTCWIPDLALHPGLAGKLSHPSKMPAIPTHYLGVLSRFEEAVNTAPINNHLLFILSGPEPQRSLFEEKIWEQLSNYNGTATIVRGLPSEQGTKESPNSGANVFNHLTAAALFEEMKKAAVVISRTGYSTIMDLAVLQKKAIMVPTPGQTEQEYLGKTLQQTKAAIIQHQENFSLATALAQLNEEPIGFPKINSSQDYKKTVDEFLKQI